MPSVNRACPAYRPGVDVAKLVAMFGIVATHVSGYGLRPTPDAVNPEGVRLLFAFFYPVFLAGLDVFALATGFLCVTSRIRPARLVRLWLQMVFTGAAVTAVLLATGLVPVTAEGVFAFLRPVSTGSWWYMTAYFVLMVVAPFLNEGLRRTPRKVLEVVLVLTLVPVCTLDFCTKAGFLPVMRGYSLQWLLLLYGLGAYFRLHGNPFDRFSARACVLGILALAGLSCLGNVLLPNASFGLLATVAAKLHFHDVTSPGVLLIGILLFTLCLKVRSVGPSVAHVLRPLAAATLGVYLIHVQPLFWRWVFIPRMAGLTVSTAWDWLLRCFGISFAIFLVCLALDTVRDRLFAVLRIGRFADALCATVAWRFGIGGEGDVP